MLKRLRRRFVLITMGIVLVMLITIFGGVYYFMSRNLEEESIRAMQNIMQIPPRETLPSEIRLAYFILQQEADGTFSVQSNRDSFIDLSDESVLQSLAESAFSNEDMTGVIQEYSLRYTQIGDPHGRKAIFMDISGEMLTLKNLVITCTGIGTLTLICFWGLSILLARWAVKPVEIAWNQQKQFVQDASHELKTPLTVIMTNAELMQENVREGQPGQQYLSAIQTMSLQMRSLVERLLDLTRADNGQNQAAFARVEWSRMVEEGVLPFEAVFFENGLTLNCTIQENIAVCGNEQQLHQILDILLDNARKYTSPEGRIRVALKQNGRGHCRLTVANTGEPLSEEDCRNIFRRFYRKDSARSRDGGFGLGLSIAESIIRGHHGKIWAESHLGENLFIAELPML